MSKFYKWRKEGDWEVYEGKYAITVGYDDKFDCFGKKDGDGTAKGKVRWGKSGLYFNPSSNVYIGQHSKVKSKNLVDKIDSTLESNSLLSIEANDKLVPSQSITLSTKKKGTVIIYPKGDVIERIHEEGHFKKGVSSERSFHYNDELPVIEYQITELNKRGMWTPKIRDRVVSDLATYSRKPNQKKRRALKDVKRIEARLGLV